MCVDHYPIASMLINKAMPLLMELICTFEILRTGVQAVTFLSTTFGDLCITLIYDSHIGAEWTEAAHQMKETLANLTIDVNNNLCVIGRSKGLIPNINIHSIFNSKTNYIFLRIKYKVSE